MNATASKSLLNSLFALSACFFFMASQPAKAAGDTIVVGQSIDLSGPNGAIGRDYVAGIKTYFDALNSSGGINGKKIYYVVRDDTGKPDLAVKSVEDLIERDQADYLIGGIGDEVTQAVADSSALKRSGQILFAPLASSTHIHGSRVMFWRPSYRQELRYIFSYFGKLGMKDIGIVYQDNSDNREPYNDLINETRVQGLRLAGVARITSSSAQVAAEAARLAKAKPGFVVVIADTIGTGLFLKEFRQHDRQTFVAGTSLTNLSMLRELAGDKAVEWTMFSQVVPSPNSATSMIQIEHLDMMRKYRDEAVSSMTLEGFAVAKTLAKAIQNVKTANRSALREWLVRGNAIDIGGLSISASSESNRLSSYLDIALLRKGSELVF
jgi:ABC-type branched-subunit amino acid transport system substrate-binding protein